MARPDLRSRSQCHGAARSTASMINGLSRIGSPKAARRMMRSSARTTIGLEALGLRSGVGQGPDGLVAEVLDRLEGGRDGSSGRR